MIHPYACMNWCVSLFVLRGEPFLTRKTNNTSNNNLFWNFFSTNNTQLSRLQEFVTDLMNEQLTLMIVWSQFKADCNRALVMSEVRSALQELVQKLDEMINFGNANTWQFIKHWVGVNPQDVILVPLRDETTLPFAFNAQCPFRLEMQRYLYFSLSLSLFFSLIKRVFCISVHFFEQVILLTNNKSGTYRIGARMFNNYDVH